MSLDQGSAVVLPTTTEIKDRIAVNERETRAFLASLRCRISELTHLQERLDLATEEEASLHEQKPLLQLLKGFLAGTHLDAEKRRMVSRTRSAILGEMESSRRLLKGRGYWGIDERTRIHYEDIKALTLLDVCGDPDAGEFRERSTASISQLRIVQREIEDLHPGCRPWRAGRTRGACT